jgi:alkylated DNA repair protein (DNA oxidative demethylase)
MTALPVVPGCIWNPGYLGPDAQQALVATLRALIAEAPLFQPVMPRSGTPFSVKMTNLGGLGWVSDVKGYRYQPLHPVTGRPWPPIPAEVLAIWEAVSGYPHPPQACLVNWYGPGAKMGLHQDRDEEEFDAPVVSVSLGDTGIFRIGGTTRGGKTQSIRLASGDVLAFGGEARLAYHGVDRLLPGTSALLKDGGRINLTLRRVTKPAA